METMDAVPDGGPPGWAMVGELRAPPGLPYLEHCRLAAATYSFIAHRLRKAGRIQHTKALAILRTWDVYSFQKKYDITCGASAALMRTLATPPPEGVTICQQVPVAQDKVLATKPVEELLNPTKMPAHMAALCRSDVDFEVVEGVLVKATNAAVCGYVYANGQFKLFTDATFATWYFGTEEANVRFQSMSVLPCFLYGSLLSPQDQACFFELLIEYMLTKSKDSSKMVMVGEVRASDGTLSICLLRARYTVLNDGQYSAFVLSIAPLPKATRKDCTVYHLRKCSSLVDDGLEKAHMQPGQSPLEMAPAKARSAKGLKIVVPKEQVIEQQQEGRRPPSRRVRANEGTTPKSPAGVGGGGGLKTPPGGRKTPTGGRKSPTGEKSPISGRKTPKTPSSGHKTLPMRGRGCESVSNLPNLPVRLTGGALGTPPSPSSLVPLNAAGVSSATTFDAVKQEQHGYRMSTSSPDGSAAAPPPVAAAATAAAGGGDGTGRNMHSDTHTGDYFSYSDVETLHPYLTQLQQPLHMQYRQLHNQQHRHKLFEQPPPPPYNLQDLHPYHMTTDMVEGNGAPALWEPQLLPSVPTLQSHENPLPHPADSILLLPEQADMDVVPPECVTVNSFPFSDATTATELDAFCLYGKEQSGEEGEEEDYGDADEEASLDLFIKYKT